MLIEYVGAVSGISGIYILSLNQDRRVYGLLLNIIASTCFGINAILCSQWGVLISQSFYFVISLIGLVSCLKENMGYGKIRADSSTSYDKS